MRQTEPETLGELDMLARMADAGHAEASLRWDAGAPFYHHEEVWVRSQTGIWVCTDCRFDTHDAPPKRNTLFPVTQAPDEPDVTDNCQLYQLAYRGIMYRLCRTCGLSGACYLGYSQLTTDDGFEIIARNGNVVKRFRRNNGETGERNGD